MITSRDLNLCGGTRPTSLALVNFFLKLFLKKMLIKHEMRENWSECEKKENGGQLD